MKKIIITGLLLIALVFVLAACEDGIAPLAAPDGDYMALIDDSMMLPDEDDNGYDYESDLLWQPNEGLPAFNSVTGEVVSVDTNDLGDYEIKITGEDGSAVLMTNFNTLTLGDAPAVGDTVTGFFPLELFATAIYPPHHMASVIVNNDSFQDNGMPFVYVCRFYERDGSFSDNQQLISASGQMVINLGGDSEITLQNGEAFDGELAGRMMVVTYTMATFSIPPQTTPHQIIVLYERAVTGPEFIELPDDWAYGIEEWEPHYDILIDGEGLVGAHVIFVGEDAIFPTHVELVPVAAALGAEVEWNTDTNVVTLEGLNGSISFVAGSYDFTVDGEIVSLYQPSVDFYGTVYVPVLFFADVFGMPSAYSFEGRIYIDSTETDMY